MRERGRGISETSDRAYITELKKKLLPTAVVLDYSHNQ
jgi:hypothetical protein